VSALGWCECWAGVNVVGRGQARDRAGTGRAEWGGSVAYGGGMGIGVVSALWPGGSCLGGALLASRRHRWVAVRLYGMPVVPWRGRVVLWHGRTFLVLIEVCDVLVDLRLRARDPLPPSDCAAFAFFIRHHG
jgi:hypothetical protein